MGVHLRCRSLQPRLLTKAFGGDRLMVRRPALNAFAGRWRIVAMDVWSNDVLDLAEKAHISFEGTSGGEIAFVAGRGWATSGTDGRLRGHIFIHQGDDSGFTCERE